MTVWVKTISMRNLNWRRALFCKTNFKLPTISMMGFLSIRKVTLHLEKSSIKKTSGSSAVLVSHTTSIVTFQRILKSPLRALGSNRSSAQLGRINSLNTWQLAGKEWHKLPPLQTAYLVGTASPISTTQMLQLSKPTHGSNNKSRIKLMTSRWYYTANLPS